MTVTQQQANDVYARFLVGRYGSEAAQIARLQVATMIARGDDSGIDAWANVFDRVNVLIADVEQPPVSRPPLSFPRKTDGNPTSA